MYLFLPEFEQIWGCWSQNSQIAPPDLLENLHTDHFEGVNPFVPNAPFLYTLPLW